jgi:thioredoxin-like negative regulator of GroEL
MSRIRLRLRSVELLAAGSALLLAAALFIWSARSAAATRELPLLRRLDPTDRVVLVSALELTDAMPDGREGANVLALLAVRYAKAREIELARSLFDESCRRLARSSRDATTAKILTYNAGRYAELKALDPHLKPSPALHAALDRFRRSSAVAGLWARTLGEAGETETAVRLAARVSSATDLAAIARAVHEAGDPRAGDLLERARSVAASTAERSAVAETLVAAGRIEEAMETAAGDRAALGAVARALAEAGEMVRARALLDRIDTYHRRGAVIRLVQRHAQAGDLEDADALLPLLDPGLDRALAAAAIVRVLCETSCLDEARARLPTIAHDWQRTLAALELVHCLLRTGQAAGARELMREIEVRLPEVASDVDRLRARVAEAWAEIGDCEKTRRALTRIPSGRALRRALTRAALAASRRGDLDEMLGLVRELADSEPEHPAILLAAAADIEKEGCAEAAVLILRLFASRLPDHPPASSLVDAASAAAGMLRRLAPDGAHAFFDQVEGLMERAPRDHLWDNSIHRSAVELAEAGRIESALRWVARLAEPRSRILILGAIDIELRRQGRRLTPPEIQCLEAVRRRLAASRLPQRTGSSVGSGSDLRELTGSDGFRMATSEASATSCDGPHLISRTTRNLAFPLIMRS